jgi:hypothetical protein
MDESFRLADAKHFKTNKSWILNTFNRVECVKYVNERRDRCFCGRLRQEHLFNNESDEYSYYVNKYNEKNGANNHLRDTFSNRSIRSENFDEENGNFGIDNLNYDYNETVFSNCNETNKKPEIWSIIDCTKKFPTNSFGNLTFQTDDAYKRTAKVFFKIESFNI